MVVSHFPQPPAPPLLTALWMGWSRTATDMDGTLHTDLWKSETSREIKKIILASFEHLQKLYWLIFYFSTSFRFSKISVECSVHICSCPWVGSLIQRHSTHPLLTMKSCFYCYISRLWVPSEFISLSHLTHATQRNDWLFTLTLFPFPGQAYYSWSTKVWIL